MATIQKVLAEIEGSYALGIIFKDFPRRIYAVRRILLLSLQLVRTKLL